MILNSIVIDNIRSYQHEEIEFPRKISLFEGDNGSGKSSILMAIEFALFGLGSQKAEALLSKKAKSGSVVLEFTEDGKKYEITRGLVRKNLGVNQDAKSSKVNQDAKNCKIRSDGEISPLSPSELKQKVLQILKFNEPADPKAESRIFRYAVFTPQETMKNVLSDPVRRLETIRRAFRIEDYSLAESNAKEVLLKIKDSSIFYKGKFDNTAELESQIKQSKEEIVVINAEITKKQAQKIELEGKESEKNKELDNLQEKNNDRIKLESEKGNLQESILEENTRIKKIQQEIVRLETESKKDNEMIKKLSEIEKPNTTKIVSELILEIASCQKINDELVRLKSERDTITADISRIKERLGEKINSGKESTQQKLVTLQKEKVLLEESAKVIKEALEKIKDDKTRKDTLKGTIQKEIAKFSDLGNSCPTCKQEITKGHHHTLVGDRQKQIDTISDELKIITDSFFDSGSKLKNYQEEIDSYQKKIDGIQNVILPGIEEYETKSKTISQTEAEISRLNTQQGKEKSTVESLTNLKDQLVRYDNSKDQIDQIIKNKDKDQKTVQSHQNESESTEQLILKKESELKQIKVELESSVNLETVIKEKNQELTVLRKDSTDTVSAIAAYDVNLKNEEEKIKEKQDKIIESKKWEAKYKKFTQYQEWLKEFFIPTVNKIEKQVLLSIQSDFNETYTRWYSILIDDPTKESMIDENFAPVVNQDGYDQPVGYLSGGESASIALAYRLTLNSLMRKETESMKSNLLILDEPTDGFSKNQLGKIQELFNELKSEQIILVSHDEELERHADTIFKISKENGVSKITKMV